MSLRCRPLMPLVLLMVAGTATAGVPLPTLVIPAFGGGVPNGVREDLIASDDLRWIAFTSTATDLDASDTDPVRDVYLTDSTTGVSTRISRDPLSGATSTGGCEARAISGDGRTVAMVCSLKGLVPGIHPSTDPWGIYLYERDGDGDGTLDEPGDIRFVRVEWDGAGSPANPMLTERLSLSADGRKLTYREWSQPLNDGGCGLYRVWLVDRDADADGVYDEAGSITGACPIPAESFNAKISGDGSVIAFETGAALVPSDTNASGFRGVDVYAKDLGTNAIEIVSLGVSGQLGSNLAWLMDISHDGTRVLFDSDSRDMFPGWSQNIRTPYLRDLAANTTEQVAYNVDTFNGTLTGVSGTGLDLSSDGTRALIWAARYAGGSVHDLQIVRIGQRVVPKRFRHGGAIGLIDAVTDRAMFMSPATDLVAGDANGADDLFLIEDAPDVALRVEGSPGQVVYYPGGGAVFTITFDNEGTSTSSVGVIRAPALATGQYIYSSPGCTRTLTTVECPIRQLHPGEGGWVRIDIRATEAGALPLTATAEVVGDVDPSDDSATAQATAIAGTDLDMYATVSPNWIIQPGGSAAISFIAENRGLIHTAPNAVMTVDIDPDITVVAGSMVTSAGANCTRTGDRFTCVFGDLAPGSQGFMRIAATSAVIGNHSVVGQATSDLPDPAPGNNTLATQLGVVAPPPPPPPDDGGDGGSGGGGPFDALLMLLALFGAILKPLRRSSTPCATSR